MNPLLFVLISVHSLLKRKQKWLCGWGERGAATFFKEEELRKENPRWVLVPCAVSWQTQGLELWALTHTKGKMTWCNPQCQSLQQPTKQITRCKHCFPPKLRNHGNLCPPPHSNYYSYWVCQPNGNIGWHHAPHPLLNNKDPKWRGVTLWRSTSFG